MATVHTMGKGETKDVPPEVGKKYWWFKHDRVLLTIVIKSVKPDAIELHWEHYLGLVNTDNPIYKGTVEWNDAEWSAVFLMEYQEPLTEKDLTSDEELCRTCGGGYFETLTDLDITRCIWCDNGRKKKVVFETPKVTRRSGLHPEVR